MKDLSKMLPHDHPMYAEAVEELKAYHLAQDGGITGADLSGCVCSLSIASRRSRTINFRLRAARQ